MGKLMSFYEWRRWVGRRDEGLASHPSPAGSGAQQSLGESRGVAIGGAPAFLSRMVEWVVWWSGLGKDGLSEGRLSKGLTPR
jgi:hypothetical protein